MNIIWTIVILGVMVFIHELGHFIAARSFGVHVEEFAIGMGPAIFKRKKGDTLYSIRLLPLGGFCSMEGEDDGNTKPGTLSGLAAWKRFVVLFAGAFMNILLALILFIGISFGSGGEVYGPVIGGVTENSPMAVFSEGDRIVRLDSTKVNIPSDISLKMFTNHGEDIDVTVLHNGEKITETITPVKDESGYKLGFYMGVVKNDFGTALSNGVYEAVFSIKTVYWSIAEMAKGDIGLDSVSGPVGVVGVVGDVVDEAEPAGAYAVFLSVIYLMALIGANLGVMNLLPFPALDGGRIVFTIFEMITKKRVPAKAEGIIHTVGFVIIMLFAVFITWNDIMKLIG